MELFDVIDSKGNPAGQIVSREKAHAEGIPLLFRGMHKSL